MFCANRLPFMDLRVMWTEVSISQTNTKVVFIVILTGFTMESLIFRRTPVIRVQASSISIFKLSRPAGGSKRGQPNFILSGRCRVLPKRLLCYALRVPHVNQVADSASPCLVKQTCPVSAMLAAQQRPLDF